MTIEVGGASEQVVVTAESPLVQTASGEKSFTITTESVSSLPLANRSYDALLGLMPGVQQHARCADARESTGRRRRQQLHARRRDGDGPGRQPAGHARQRRGDFGSARRDVDLSGRVRPIERSAGQRGDQERHQPVSRSDLRRRAQLEVEREQQDEHSERRSRRRSRTSATGASPSAVRSGRPAGTTSCSSTSTRSSTRGRSATPSTGIVCRPLLERQGDFSQIDRQPRATRIRTSRIRR